MPKILAPDLDRLVQNCLLFSDEKAVRLQEVLFEFDDSELVVSCCDDYVTVSDFTSLSTETKIFSLSVSDTLLLGKWIKEEKKVVHKTEINISFKMTGVNFEAEESSIFLSYKTPSDLWTNIKHLLDKENIPMCVLEFAIRPERLERIHRLKAPREENKEAPVHLRGIDINGHLIIQFKKGSTITGAIQPVRTDLVKEEYLW